MGDPRETAPPAAPPRDRPTDEQFWRAWRVLVSLVWVGLVVAAVLSGERESSLGELDRAVDAGAVTEVTILGDGLTAGETGTATQYVSWQRYGVTFGADVHIRTADASYGEDTASIVTRDVARELAQRHPGLRIGRAAAPAESWTTGLLGFRTPGWVGAVVLLAWFGTLALLVGGPDPWRATKWAWFWLLLLGTPIGLPAFLLLGGPGWLPGPRPGRRRLTGGWAFLLALALGGATGHFEIQD